MTGGAPHLELHEVSKRCGGVHAVRGVDLVVAHDSVHALVGADGAGESTLSKIVSVGTAPDEGELVVGGRPVCFRGPRDALRAGLARTSQEVAVVPSRSVLDNVLLGAATGAPAPGSTSPPCARRTRR